MILKCPVRGRFVSAAGRVFFYRSGFRTSLGREQEEARRA
jgi:hypothetical protein